LGIVLLILWVVSLLYLLNSFKKQTPSLLARAGGLFVHLFVLLALLFFWQTLP